MLIMTISSLSGSCFNWSSSYIGQKWNTGFVQVPG